MSGDSSALARSYRLIVIVNFIRAAPVTDNSRASGTINRKRGPVSQNVHSAVFRKSTLEYGLYDQMLERGL